MISGVVKDSNIYSQFNYETTSLESYSATGKKFILSKNQNEMSDNDDRP